VKISKQKLSELTMSIVDPKNLQICRKYLHKLLMKRDIKSCINLKEI